MKTFKQYTTANIEHLEEVSNFLDFMTICDSSETVTEAMEYFDNDLLIESDGGKIDSVLKKLGLHAKKTKPGLISQFKNAGKGVLKFLVAAAKGDTSTMKKMAGKEVKKEDVIEFLINLDQATLHLFTGYIHAIEAITGWHLGANTKNSSEKITATVSKVSDALAYIKNKLITNTEKTAKSVIKAIEKITKITPSHILDS